MSTPTTVQGNYQNMPTMSQSHPNYHAAQMLLQQQSQILAPQTVGTISHGVLVSTGPRTIMEPAHTKNSLDLIHFTNVNNKSHQTTMGLQTVSRIGDNYDRLRAVKYDSYNSTPVHKAETMPTAYQNVRTHDHFPASVANFNSNNVVSSDSSSSMNSASAGVSSTGTPNTSSDTSTCASNEPSVPSSPDNNATIVTENVRNEPDEGERERANAPKIVPNANESSTATNTSLNVTLPPSESPKLNNDVAVNQTEVIILYTLRLFNIHSSVM